MDKFNRTSVATVKAPEFLNITSISPLISKCEIKVLYTGKNRNGSFISKDVATEMAQTLPGSPIVGYFIEQKDDFGDHGDQMIIDGEGVKFKKLTKPYGFVAPDAKIWFKEFQDTDEFGNIVYREYLMTEGYLWTEQYEECKRVLTNGNPQSMELDEKTLKGYWSEDTNSGCDFFIINDAVFSKLCILGEDVEPCFEGASVSAFNYSLDDNFKNTLFNMMSELKFELQKGGELSMDIENQIDNETVEDFSLEDNSTEVEAEAEVVAEETEVVSEEVIDEFKKADEEEDKEESKKDEEEEDEETPEEKDDYACGNKDEKKKYSHSDEEFDALSVEYSSLQEKYSALESEIAGLREFKLNVENEKKDTLINSFYMLSDEDKAEVIENKAQYSLEDIEAKLSVICVRKKVNFNLDEDEKDSEETPVTFNLHAHENVELPAWLKAVEDVRMRKA